MICAARRLLFLAAFLLVNGGSFGSLDDANSVIQKENADVGLKMLSMEMFKVRLKSDHSYILMYMDSEVTATFEVSVVCRTVTKEYVLKIDSTEKKDVVRLDAHLHIKVSCHENVSLFEYNISYTNNVDNQADDVTLKPEIDFDLTNSSGNEYYFLRRDVNITLKSGVIGVSSVSFELQMYNLKNTKVTSFITLNDTLNIDVIVVRAINFVDTIFVVCVYVLSILEMLTFGTQLDLSTLKHTLKKPVAPLIGFVCQYLGMPLIAYGIAKVIASDSLAALGIFVAGICPGGGSSNIYAYLVDGDLSLSITMTTVSTIMSLVMMPLWLYTLGSEFLSEYKVQIPYEEILLTLSVIIVPLTAGIVFKYKFPKIAKLVGNILPTVLTILALCLIITGVYSNLYIFRLFSLKIVIVGCCLPYIGFLLGGLVAVICRQPWRNIKTIAIEIGMQNTGIGFILLANAFPEPLGDIATVAPISSEVMSPIPPFIISIVYLIIQKCCKKYKPVTQTDNSEKNDELTLDSEKDANDQMNDNEDCRKLGELSEASEQSEVASEINEEVDIRECRTVECVVQW